jgi:hypothetical protein
MEHKKSASFYIRFASPVISLLKQITLVYETLHRRLQYQKQYGRCTVYTSL